MWICITVSRPDLVLKVSMLSRTVGDENLDAQIVKCRKLVTKARETKYTIRYGDLGNLNELELHVYSDAAYANQDRIKSTVGIIIFLSGPKGCTPILWRSRV